MIKNTFKIIYYFIFSRLILSILTILFNNCFVNVKAEEVVKSVNIRFQLINTNLNIRPCVYRNDDISQPIELEKSDEKYPLYLKDVEIDCPNDMEFKYHYGDCNDKTLIEDFYRSLNITPGESYSTENEFYNRPKTKRVKFLPEIWERPYEPSSYDIFGIDYVGTFYLLSKNATLLENMNQIPHSNVKVPFEGIYIGEKDTYKFEDKGWELSIAGNYSRMFTKQSFKIVYKGDDEPKFLPVKLKLKGFANDATMLREPICLELLKKVGIPTYRGSFARLYIDNDYYGLYYFEDTMKKVYIKNLFHQKGKNPDIGPLFQAIPNKGIYNASLNYIDDKALSYPNWNQTWDCKINGTNYGSKEESFTNLIDFMKKLNQTDLVNKDENTLLHSIYDIFELDIFIRLLAMDYLVGRFHGYWRNPSNFLIYYHPALKRYVIFPVDYTSTLGYKYSEHGYTYKTDFDEWRLPKDLNDPLINMIMNTPYLKYLFDSTLKLIVNSLFTPEFMFPFIDSLTEVIKYDLTQERELKPYHSSKSIIEEVDIKVIKEESVREDANGFPSNSTVDTTIITKKNTTITLIDPGWTIDKSLSAIENSVSNIGYGIKEWIEKRSQFVDEQLANATLVSAGSLITRPSDPSNLYSDSLLDYFLPFLPSDRYRVLFFVLAFLIVIIAIVYIIHLKYKKPIEMEGDEHDLRKYNDSFFQRVKTRFNFSNNDGLFINLGRNIKSCFKNIHTKARNMIYHKSRNID